MPQNRILADNAIMAEAAILTPSSEEATLPAAFLHDQLRQKPWRTLTGWTIIAGFNDKLDFERPPGTPLVATIPPGNYIAAQDLAAAIVTALEAADSAPLWACDYGALSANKFRIRDAAGAPVNFNLMWLTGANAATSIGKCLGFDTSANDTGANTYTADNVAYQSRHYLKINRSDGETIAATAVALLDHNGSVANTIKIQAHTSDSWGAPGTSQTLTGNPADNPRVFFFGGDVKAWWRLLIEDVQNPDGYVEFGIVYLGQYFSPSINVSADLADEVEDFTAVESGIDGTHFIDEHRRRDRWTLAWAEMDLTTRSFLDQFVFDQTPAGKNFFFVWDLNAPSGAGDGTDGSTYGFYAGLRKQYVPDPYWTYSLLFIEAL